jgi:hypothetical protein
MHSSSLNGVTAELQPLLRKVTDVIQQEIDQLLNQKTILRRRAGNLRSQLAAARLPQACDPVVSAAKVRTRARSRRAATRSFNDATLHSCDKLMRACRIALMDAGGTADADQIHSLIVRRGSFDFSDLSTPSLDSIMRALKMMYEAGELSSTEGRESVTTAIPRVDCSYSDKSEVTSCD